MSNQSQPIALELIVRNHPGVMTHICGLFARRAFNVDGILCLPMKNSDKSRIWLLVQKMIVLCKWSVRWKSLKT